MRRKTSSLFIFWLLALSTPAMAQTVPAGPLGNLQKRVTGLETAVSTLQSSVSGLDGTVSNLQAAVSALQSAVSVLQSQGTGDPLLAAIGRGDPAFAATQFLEDMPGMTASFQTASPGCMTATFSAQVSATSTHIESTGRVLNDILLFSVLLDGTPMDGHSEGGVNESNPAGTIAHTVPDDASPESVSYKLVKCNVPAQSHTVKVQWQCPFPFQGTNEDGSAVGRYCSVSGRTLVVRGE